MSVFPFRIGPWPKGVNLIDPPRAIDVDELVSCLNWRLDPLGYPVKRPGHKKYGSAPAKVNGNVFVNFLARYYKASGSKELLAAAGQKLFKGTDGTGAWTQIPIDGSSGAVLNTSNLYEWFVYKDRIYILDGTKPVRYNGTDAVYAGHFLYDTSTFTFTPGIGGGAIANGTYKYVMISVQGDMGTGGPGVATTVVMGGANNQVVITVITVPGASYEATAKRLYRTKAGGSIYFFITELATATVSYTDVAADAALIEELVLAHGPRTDHRFAVLGHDERVYWFGRTGLNASIVEVSEPGFPDRILDLFGFFPVANNDGDTLTGGARIPAGVIFFKRNSMWLSRGFGTGIINISPTIGCISPFAISEVPGGLIFVSQLKKVYFYGGSGVPEEIGRKISPELEGITDAALSKAVSAYHDFRYILAYDKKGAQTYNSFVLEFDFLGQKWEGPHSNGDKLTPSYFSVWDSVKDRGELYWGESKTTTGSYVYGRTETTQDDDNVKPLARFRTGQKLNSNFATAREVLFTKVLLTALFTAGGTLKVAVILDDGANQSTALIPVPPVFTGALIWGIDAWGTKPWGASGGGTGQVLEGTFGPDARGRIPAIEIEDAGTAAFAKLEELVLLAEILPH